MKVNTLLIPISIGLVCVGVQVLACESTVDPATSLPTQPSSTDSAEAGTPLPIVDTAMPLPPLSEAEIESLQAELVQGIDTWFGLAGLDKMPAPPPLSPELQQYRERWSQVSVDITTFLGTWHDGEAYSYSVSIFPSRTVGQVCILEFKPEWSLNIFNEATGEYGKDIISEQIFSFSIATVQDGHLRSSQVRSVGSATARTRFAVGEPYPVLLMGLIDDQDITHVVALASPPTLPANLPEDLVAPVSEALSDYGCVTED